MVDGINGMQDCDTRLRSGLVINSTDEHTEHIRQL